MSRKSAESVIEKMSDETDLKERIKELEKKVRDGEEAALKRVCAAMELNPEEIKTKEAIQPERQVRCFVSFPIRVNSIIYKGDCTVGYQTFMVLQQAMGDRRQRLLRELTGNNYILKELDGGGFAPQLIGQVNLEDAGVIR